MSTNVTVITISPDALEAMIGKAVASAVASVINADGSTDGKTLLRYDEAMRFLNMKSTMFSRAVSDGAIPYILVGRRKMFRRAVLAQFQGYTPTTEAERRFRSEIEK